jgi:hypothetical protein
LHLVFAFSRSEILLPGSLLLTHTTLLAVVEWEIRFVPPNIEALIRTKTIVAITNEVDILGDRQEVDAHVACLSALFTHYSSINHFEMIEAWGLKLLHKKINLGGEHVHLFKLVNLAGAGLSALLIPALVRGHLLNQFTSFFNTERTTNRVWCLDFHLEGVIYRGERDLHRLG